MDKHRGLMGTLGTGDEGVDVVQNESQYDQRQNYPQGQSQGQSFAPGQSQGQSYTQGQYPSQTYTQGQTGQAHKGTTQHGPLPGLNTGVGPTSYQCSDQQIHDEVCHRLTQHGHLNASNIEAASATGGDPAGKRAELSGQADVGRHGGIGPGRQGR